MIGGEQQGQGGQAVHYGHFDVEHHHVDVVQLLRVECRLAVARPRHHQNGRIGFQYAADGSAYHRAVVANHYARRLRRWSRYGRSERHYAIPKEGKDEESSSFLKKRTKKLLLASMRTDRALRVNQQNKSFLVLFFKKELLLFIKPAQPG
jgi:hypothetical protein